MAKSILLIILGIAKNITEKEKSCQNIYFVLSKLIGTFKNGKLFSSAPSKRSSIHSVLWLRLNKKQLYVLDYFSLFKNAILH